MLLTLFYMISTWIQSWKLLTLKNRLIAAINYEADLAKPSIMFCIKQPPESSSKQDNIIRNIPSTSNGNGISENLLTSHLCSNGSAAKLKDLIWSQGDKRLCTIYPEQEVDVSQWLYYPFGKTHFPLSMDNCNQIRLTEDSIIYVLIEADIEHFHPNAFAKAIKLEDYGYILSWTTDRVFAAVMKTDVDHLSKLSIALMQGQCFINNGLVLTRIESIKLTGKPCKYTSNDATELRGKKLVGRAQWEAHMDTLKLFSNIAKDVCNKSKPLEVINLQPSVIITPGFEMVDSPIFQLDMDEGDDSQIVERFAVPSTPPPTPATVDITDTSAPELLHNFVSSVVSETIVDNKFVPKSANNLSTISSEINNCDNSSQLDSHNQSTEAPKQSNAESNKLAASNMKQIPTNRASRYSPERTTIDNTYIPSKDQKPPNILIYADSSVAKDNIERALKQTLNKDKYIIYTLTPEDIRRDVWKDQAKLTVVCGNVDNETASQLVDYIVRGGKLLALCSDALHTILPSFKTAEVREHELVRFSYGRWKNVRMMHHIFCYQASPVKSRFSQDNEDGKTATRPTPANATVKDTQGKSHTFYIKVLGAEETWNTPSIVLADLPSTGGKAIFSQIHLEADPSQYELEEKKFHALKESDRARLEILCDLLGTHLNLDSKVSEDALNQETYTPGFFLGRHEHKLEVLERLKDKIEHDDIFETTKIKLQFCGGTSQVKAASASLLPILIHQCPENFSTVEYFENLKTKEIGRLVVYSDIMTSTMDVTAGSFFDHGLVVIAGQQAHGRGRNKNVWLSPKGCVTYTLQLRIPLDSYLGQHLPIIQHLSPVAVVSAIKSIPGYENIDLRIKWPNDIYVGNKIKIGGLIVTTLVEANNAICNIGVGVNLSNNLPTCSINNVIEAYNKKNGTKLKTVGYEEFLARVFNTFESLYDAVQDGDLQYFYERYYNYWLHTDVDVRVTIADGTTKKVKILGIDENGFLEVQEGNNKIFTVQPDGNSFDILKGLIAPSLTR